MNRNDEKLSLLLFYRWKRSYKFYSILFLLYLLGCSPLLYIGNHTMVRYETFYDSKGCQMIFYIVLTMIICYSIGSLLELQRKSNAFARYMLLPKARTKFILSEVIVTISMILLLLSLQAAIYYVGFRNYVSYATFYDVTNGWYLAIARNVFMSHFLPLTLTQLCILFMSVVTLSTLSVYLGIFFHKRTTLGIVAVSILVFLYVWQYPVGLSFSLMRGFQLCLMILVFIACIFCFRYQLKHNEFRG